MPAPADLIILPFSEEVSILYGAPVGAEQIRVYSGADLDHLTVTTIAEADGSVRVGGLENGVTYYFAVASVDQWSHEGDWSEVVTGVPVLESRVGDHFTWGRHVGGCDISTYTFEPIP